jgi:DNA-binding transcriptional MerR regulator
MEKSLPAIPAKRYFTIGEVSELCGVKPYVLRYWEQEFTQLKPMKRRGNRRYYQHHEVLLIRRIRELLYDQGFTISGARNRLSDAALARAAGPAAGNGKAHAPRALAHEPAFDDADLPDEADEPVPADASVPHSAQAAPATIPVPEVLEIDLRGMRRELLAIRKLLSD